jgi:hypothetical protein
MRLDTLAYHRRHVSPVGDAALGGSDTNNYPNISAGLSIDRAYSFRC